MHTKLDEFALPDARLLRMFDLLYKTRSVTRTAEQMGQTQPVVSIWLARLRRQLGDPLFVRTPAGMHPTPRADDLIGTARAALHSLKQLAAEAPAFDPLTATRNFCICMTDSGHITMLPAILARVRKLAPGVRLETAGIGADTAEALQSGTADLAIGLIPELEAGFYQQALFSQDWVCVMQSPHPRIGRTLSLKRYCSEPHLSISQAVGQQLLDAALKSAGIRRNVILDLPGFLGVSGILSSTDLIATLPRRIGERLAAIGNLQTCRCPVPIPSFTVRQHWHTRYHNDPGNRWLRTLCAQLFVQHRAARQDRGSGSTPH